MDLIGYDIATAQSWRYRQFCTLLCCSKVATYAQKPVVRYPCLPACPSSSHRSDIAPSRLRLPGGHFLWWCPAKAGRLSMSTMWPDNDGRAENASCVQRALTAENGTAVGNVSGMQPTALEIFCTGVGFRRSRMITRRSRTVVGQTKVRKRSINQWSF